MPVLVAENAKDIRGWMMDALMDHMTKEKARIAHLSKNSASPPSSSSSSSSGSGKASAGALGGRSSSGSGSHDSTDTAAALLYSSDNEKMRPLALGFDVEWRPAFAKGCSNKVSLVQLSTASSVLLVQLNVHSEREGTLPPLRDLMISPEVKLVGVGVKCDMKKLETDHGKCACCEHLRLHSRHRW